MYNDSFEIQKLQLFNMQTKMEIACQSKREFMSALVLKFTFLRYRVDSEILVPTHPDVSFLGFFCLLVFVLSLIVSWRAKKAQNRTRDRACLKWNTGRNFLMKKNKSKSQTEATVNIDGFSWDKKETLLTFEPLS